MATLLADPPSPAEDPARNGVAAPSAGTPAPDAAAPAPGETCSRCGAQLAPGQDWCTNCGAGRPGALSRPGWRPAIGVLVAVAVLVLVAGAAAFAALKKTPPKRPRDVVIARVTPPAAPPAASTPAPVPTISTPTTVAPPKIPLATTTPKVPVVVPPPASTGTGSTGGSSQTTGGAGTETTPEETKPSAILLDTNAASTYNPSALPATDFGDPSLAIDGEPATGWTAQVEAATAPAMGAGLLIDLKTQHRLGKAELITSTPGMTIQVLGANGTAAPATITTPGWHHLLHTVVMKTRHQHFKLKEANHSYRWVVLWISKAPAGSTPAAPGHVSVNEIELFPAS